MNASTRIERSDRWTPWGRLCSPRIAGNSRPGADTGAIHPMDCSCGDCRYEAQRRSLRLDLVVIGLGVAAALAAIGILELLGMAG